MKRLADDLKALRIQSLPEGVTTVNEAVVASHVTRARRGEVDGEVVEVVHSTKTLLGSVVHPDALLGVKSRDTVEGGVHVARGDGVDADAIASPLGGKRLGELDDGSFRGVVAGLLLGVVDNRARHGSNVDNRTAIVFLDHLLSDSLCDEERAGDVDVEQASELLSVIGLGLDV
jgi:hypothetical protein